MRIALFGGSFNPPHSGHVQAAREARRLLDADRLIIIPSAIAPHKEQSSMSPTPDERLGLTKLAFAGEPDTTVSDIEVKRGGTSYTVDTLENFAALYPDDELILLMGADMLLCFDTKWRSFERILEIASLGVFPRQGGQDKQLTDACDRLRTQYGARVTLLKIQPIEVSSTEIRQLLPERSGCEFLPDAVYSEIIRRRHYDAAPNLSWLIEKVSEFMDEKRMNHVRGCAEEARQLARRWGADPLLAAEAGILHDITKKLKAPEQLKLCEKYGIITDVDERENYKLLHSKTGAALARDLFGINDEVYGAICWHTTGRADMTLLEKLIYIADYIEPNRSFEGVDLLRQLAYEDIDTAVLTGLKMSLDDLKSHGKNPHENSLSAYRFLLDKCGSR